MGLDQNDQNFYNQRASDVQDAVTQGAPTRAADLVVHAIVEGGLDAIEHLTDAVKRNK